MTYAQQSGIRAMDRSAFGEAGAHLAEALAALAHLPEEKNRLRQGLEIRWLRASAHAAMGEFDRQRAVAEEALMLTERLGDRRAVAFGTARVANALWQVGDLKGALPMGERALAAAREYGDIRFLVNATQNLAMIYQSVGEVRRAAALASHRDPAR